MLRVDLAAAGVPFKDGSGAEFGFHSLRAQYATDLVETGASLRVVQEMMRVGDLKLVQRYAKVGVHDRVAALQRLAEHRAANRADTGADTASRRRRKVR